MTEGSIYKLTKTHKLSPLDSYKTLLTTPHAVNMLRVIGLMNLIIIIEN